MTPEDFPLTPEEDRGMWACACLIVILGYSLISYLFNT